MLTPWRHVNSQGVIADTPGTRLQYRFTFHEEVPVIVPLMDGTLIKGYWHVQILDAAGGLVMDQEVEVRGLVVSLNLVGVAFYVFLPDDSGTKVKTTLADGSSPEFMGPEEGIWTDDTWENPGWGQGDFYLWATWTSPVYQVVIPGGARFRIVKHTVGIVTLRPAVASIETRLEAGAAAAALRSPEHGMVWLARPVSNGIEVIGTVDLRGVATQAPALPWSPDAPVCSAPLRSLLPVTNASRPALVRLRCRTHLALVYQQGQAVWAAHCWTNGQDTPAGTWSDPMRLASNCTLLAVAPTPDGSMLYLLVKQGGQVCRVACAAEFVDGYKVFREGTPEPVILDDGSPFPALADQLHSLFISGGVATLVAAGGLTVEAYTSNDGLRTWRA
jgi:hypothetical protein